MKHKNIFTNITALLIAFIVLTACTSDNDSAELEAEASLLVDKWWYDSDDFAGDVYFNSNGNYQQKAILLENEVTASGKWKWEDEAKGILKVSDLQGEAQAASQVWFKIKDLKENSFTIQQSVDGTNYSTEFHYVDTDN